MIWCTLGTLIIDDGRKLTSSMTLQWNFFVLENNNFRENREHQASGSTHYMASSEVDLDLQKRRKAKYFSKCEGKFKIRSAILYLTTIN